MRSSAAAGVRHLVLISSVAVYGEGATPGTRSRHAGPSDPTPSAKPPRRRGRSKRLNARPCALQSCGSPHCMDRGTVATCNGFSNCSHGGVSCGSATERIGKLCFTSMTLHGAAFSRSRRMELLSKSTTWGRRRPSPCSGRRARRRARTTCTEVACSRRIGGSGARSLRLLLPTRGRTAHEALTKWLKDDVYSADRFARRFGFHAGCRSRRPCQPGGMVAAFR